MVNIRPNVDPNGLYNQKEAAAALNVERHTIARYEADGVLPFRVRKAGRSKVCTGAAIIKAWENMYL